MHPRLSQHFLRDPLVVRTILEAADLQPDNRALEIGPGKGVLTEPLLERVQQLTAVELDRTLAARLQERFGDHPSWKLVQGDILRTDLQALFPEASPERPIKILGNLPYAITSPIFDKLLSWPGWNTGVFLVQQEVGDRMRSRPGSRSFGILSLAVQLFADVEKIRSVPPGAFVPPPRVRSMVIRLRRKSARVIPDSDIPAFFDLAHAAFAHRRKRLTNSLALFARAPKQKVEAWLRAQNVPLTARAESLRLEDYAHFANPWAIFRREIDLT